VLEPLNLLLSALALVLAVYAIIVARSAVRSAEVETPLARWEDEVAQLSNELVQAAQQAGVRLSERQEEMQTQLERAEQILQALQAQPMPAPNAPSDSKLEKEANTTERVERAVLSVNSLDRQIHLLVAEGVSLPEIARQTGLAREEVSMRLRLIG
jgi:hypothetical protein